MSETDIVLDFSPARELVIAINDTLKHICMKEDTQIYCSPSVHTDDQTSMQ